MFTMLWVWSLNIRAILYVVKCASMTDLNVGIKIATELTWSMHYPITSSFMMSPLALSTNHNLHTLHKLELYNEL